MGLDAKSKKLVEELRDALLAALEDASEKMMGLSDELSFLEGKVDELKEKLDELADDE